MSVVRNYLLGADREIQIHGLHNMFALWGERVVEEHEGRDYPDNFIIGREEMVFDHETGDMIPVPLTDCNFDPCGDPDCPICGTGKEK